MRRRAVQGFCTTTFNVAVHAESTAPLPSGVVHDSNFARAPNVLVFTYKLYGAPTGDIAHGRRAFAPRRPEIPLGCRDVMCIRSNLAVFVVVPFQLEARTIFLTISDRFPARIPVFPHDDQPVPV